MTTFSGAVQAISLAALGSLLAYTLVLVRMGRLSAHLVVSWIVAALVAALAIVLWGRLPLVSLTSSLGDRELLVVLAVCSFVFVAYLMLDSLQRISHQSAQITRLAQELALLRAGTATTSQASEDGPVRTHGDDRGRATPRPADHGRDPGPVARTALALWLVACFLLYVQQGYFALPAWLHHLLLAAYKE